MVHCVITFLVIHIIFLYTSCLGIQCYQCDSYKDPKCANGEVDDKYLQNCPDSHKYCRKISSTFYFKSPADHLTVRECAMSGSETSECYKGKYTRMSYQLICECRNSEGCNSSSILRVKNYRILSIIVIILLVY